MTTRDSVLYTTGKIHMIIFQQNHVEQSDTMIHATTYLHSFFFEHTHARSCLAGIENASMQTFEFFHIPVSHRSDTAHALHHIEHKTLGLQ